MKRSSKVGILAVALFILLLGALCGSNEEQTPQSEQTSSPPEAKQQEHKLSLHGATRIDPYYWMNDRTNQAVNMYIDEENAYTKAMFEPYEFQQMKFLAEMKARIPIEDESPPIHNKGYFYYMRYDEDHPVPMICRKKGTMEAEEEIILDFEVWSWGPYSSLSFPKVSPDNKKIVFGLDHQGRRFNTLYFKNLETHQKYTDEIPNTTGLFEWANDSRTVFYTRQDPNTLRHNRLYKHTLGTPRTDDILIYEEPESMFYATLTKSISEEYIFLILTTHTTTEIRYLEADKPEEAFKLLYEREVGVFMTPFHVGGNYFYLHTNDHAPNFRIVKVPIDSPGKDNWEDVIPHDPTRYINNFIAYEKYLVLEQWENGFPQLVVHDLSQDTSYPIDIGFGAGDVYGVNITQPGEPDEYLLRYSVNTLRYPAKTYDYDLQTQSTQLVHEEKVEGDYDPEAYVEKRIEATATDGTTIPISILYPKGIQLDGSNPAYVYGYGSYGIKNTIDFSIPRLSLLEEGFIFAFPHIRGGSELGAQWYYQGRRLNKMNTFTDFIDACSYLVAEGYTNPNKLFAHGGSAGGMLMGAVVNMQPDLFRGVIATVPFVDVVTTLLDDTIPLSVIGRDEFGDPTKKEVYEYQMNYSPYDNVKKQDYPAMFIVGGLYDSQVQYWEPLKWTAKLRAMKTDENPIYLLIDPNNGHGARIPKPAEYTFIMNLLKDSTDN